MIENTLNMNRRDILVNWIIPENSSPKNYDCCPASVWIRCFETIRFLEPRGFRFTINNPRPDAAATVFLRMQNDASLALARRLKSQGQCILHMVVANYFELDGNLEAIGGNVTQKHLDESQRMCDIADSVVVCSRYLQQAARKCHNDVRYIPDSVSRDVFKFTASPSRLPARGPLTLAWAGQSSKAGPLGLLAPWIDDRRYALRVLADAPPSLPCPFSFSRWNYKSFPREIAKAGLCVSPRIIDNSYDRGHSNFKIMVFLAQGIPALVSPVDSYLEVIRDGKNGFVCRTEEEWSNAFDSIYSNRENLAAMSAEAIRSAEPYLTERVVDQYEKLFQDAANRGGNS